MRSAIAHSSPPWKQQSWHSPPYLKKMEGFVRCIVRIIAPILTAADHLMVYNWNWIMLHKRSKDRIHMINHHFISYPLYSATDQERKKKRKMTTSAFLEIKCKAFIKIAAAYLTVSSGRQAAPSQLSTAPLRDSMCVTDYPHSNHTAERPVAFSHKSHWPVCSVCVHTRLWLLSNCFSVSAHTVGLVYPPVPNSELVMRSVIKKKRKKDKYHLAAIKPV